MPKPICANQKACPLCNRPLPVSHSTHLSQQCSYDTLATTISAMPSSSLLTSIFIVTPLFALNAMRTIPATLPPVIVLPYNFSVCVLVDRLTSVPSRGCRESVWGSCCVASTAHRSLVKQKMTRRTNRGKGGKGRG
jgi:hypothetical protein